MNIRSFNVTPVSHFVKDEPLDKNIIFFLKYQHIYMCFTEKKIFKHNEQKGLKLHIILNEKLTKYLLHQKIKAVKFRKFFFKFFFPTFCLLSTSSTLR